MTQHGVGGPPEVLVRLQAAVSAGRIAGAGPRYQWHVSRADDVERVMAALWPFLGEVKRAQYTARMDEWRTDVARRAPLHPSQRTHCPRDHEYTPENTLLNRGSRQCKQCNRDRAREYQRRRRSQT